MKENSFDVYMKLTWMFISYSGIGF